jgi:hypothetical protein
MRTLLLLLPLTLLLPLATAACGCGEEPEPVEPELVEPEVPTPPPISATGEELAALLPQEPLPEGVVPATPRPRAEETPTPEPVAAPEAPTEPAAPAGDVVPMTIVEAVIARQVVDRQPQGSGPFTEGTEVACYTKIDNPSGQRRVLRHRWYHEGVRKSDIKLTVKAASWRTWSEVPVFGKGAWRVDIVDEAADVVMTSLTFEVQ